MSEKEELYDWLVGNVDVAYFDDYEVTENEDGYNESEWKYFNVFFPRYDIEAIFRVESDAEFYADIAINTYEDIFESVYTDSGPFWRTVLELPELVDRK